MINLDEHPVLATVIDQIREALIMFADLKVEVEAMESADLWEKPGDVCSGMILGGTSSGCLYLSFERKLALTITAGMLSAEPDEVEDADPG